MSSSLSRRIRRIGLLPTTYRESTETYLKKNEEGKEVEATRIRRTPVRHRDVLSAEEKDTKAQEITAEWRARRRERTAKKAA